MVASRVNVLWGILGLVGGTALGAWYMGSRIQSPAEVAARTAPPEPSPILVPVESRVLSSDVVTRGTVRFGLPQPISIAPSIVKGGAGLISSLPRPNTQFKEGDVIMSASGRPVLVLRGAAPAFRDMSPGTSGSDVQQLEEALARLGFDPGPVDGNYDQKTSLAVERMYQKAGWDAFGPTREQRAAIATLERDWSDAARSRLAAESARDTAVKAVAAARAIAEQNIRQATIDSALRFGTGRQLADARTGKSLLIQTERARGTYSAAMADADIKTQMADRALVVLDPRQTEMTKAAAEAKLRVARSAQRKVRVEAELAIENATREASLANERIKAAEGAVKAASLEGERSVRAAQEQQTLAEFDVKVATERYERLDRELAAARAKLGVQVPADEVVFIPSLPIRVHEVTASVAGNATGPVMSVTDNELSIDSQLAIEAAPLVKPGMKVAVDEQALGIKANGIVETVANTPGTRGVDGYHFYLGVKVESTPVALAGFSVRLAIPIETTKGPVIAVPTSALSLAADGTSRVLVDRSGRQEYVTVQPGLSTGGYVEVNASDERLAPGQMVVVGYKTAEPTAMK
ncbi:peptidoglycan-binding protein [Bradyrhizobium japonicum]|uniref:Peptidoglycan-binding protein n=1 Tax=Bradyrhizobium japonicum TaxID=375 RepID=A0A0A3XMP3_BRAJP|nr:peptidoglycan-binding protein [Bradyrhizobium japonicum]KGT75672.1 peptidoglycan-binding protein [Bradyrhizobium japonicum]MCS3895204.1 peptidoglycan hydrolase-like protein with peptidoglycan-binding domain [Bradyrhizobium japonicum USDA 38]MCS3947719.1 peptidoglycan hydrolase-like protein with peptidoglycan-binding domain [Bradyrhizobium japonicum]MCW2219451.1 peptidoglycan hydrolase-like protein with peptidoglycan-binding domain [Bradyrhizobium japonicum]MCW2344065.1 peptidoglycan hydrola